MVIGRESAKSLYSDKLVTFEDDQGAYDQKDAAGFIKLNALCVCAHWLHATANKYSSFGQKPALRRAFVSKRIPKGVMRFRTGSKRVGKARGGA